MAEPVITFLSDYGLRDHFVGVCHGVMASICPQARVIDITHGIPRHDARAGAMVLASALEYMPAGVHLAVVDPDVGAERRAVALRLAGGRVLVGPDNGLLSVAAERGGGIDEAIEIGASRHRLEPIAATFHGRDLFAPVAASLAAGAAFREAGEPLDAEGLVKIELPAPELVGGTLGVLALYADHFGNVQLNASHEDLAGTGLKLGRPARIELTDGTSQTAQYVRTFADASPGGLILYEDADRMLALAVSHGSAATLLRLAPGETVRIIPR